MRSVYCLTVAVLAIGGIEPTAASAELGIRQCQALTISINRTVATKAALVERAKNATRAQAVRLGRDLVRAQKRVDRAAALYARATGTRFEGRAFRHLEFVVKRKEATRIKVARAKKVLRTRAATSIKRITAKIKRLRRDRTVGGCGVAG